MTQQLEAVQKLGKDSFDTAVKTLELTSASTKAILAETVEYTKSSAEQGAATFEKLVGVKSLDKVIEIQTDYFKTAFEGFVAHSTKTRELHTKLIQDSLAPFSAFRSTAEAALASAKPTARAK